MSATVDTQQETAGGPPRISSRRLTERVFRIRESGIIVVLIVFVAIVGINAGNSLLAQLTGALALKIFLVGFVACSVPPIIVWAIGWHVFKINAAVLMGGVAGARSHSGPCREAAVEIGSNVPWIGFPVAYALSGILLETRGRWYVLSHAALLQSGHAPTPIDGQAVVHRDNVAFTQVLPEGR